MAPEDDGEQQAVRSLQGPTFDLLRGGTSANPAAFHRLGGHKHESAPEQRGLVGACYALSRC